MERLLLGRAETHQYGSAHLQTHCGQRRRSGFGAFGVENVTLHDTPARAAIFLRPGRCDPAALVEHLVPASVEVGLGKDTCLPAGRRPQFGREFFGKECLHLVAKGEVCRREREVHGCSLVWVAH